MPNTHTHRHTHAQTPLQNKMRKLHRWCLHPCCTWVAFFFLRNFCPCGGVGLTAFSSVQSLSPVRPFSTPWTATPPGFPVHHRLPELLKLKSIKSLMPSNYLILHCPLLPPSIFPSISVCSNELVLHIRWPKYWMEFQLQHQSFQ